MQELRSTDILDKEILSDSRRKAEKILKNSDSECKELLDSLDSEIQKAKLEKTVKELTCLLLTDLCPLTL